MKPVKTILLSLPWDDYQRPSLAIGGLAAYAKTLGFKVQAYHAHLEAAALLGFDDYEKISEAQSSGEVLCASALFPECRKGLIKFAERQLDDANRLANRVKRVLRSIYKEIDWKEYGLIGFSVNHDQLFSSLLFASWIKRDFSNTRIVLGGRCVANELGSSVLNNFRQIDWCINGEGEGALVDIIGALTNEDTAFEEGVPGLIYRSGENVVRNPIRQLRDLKGLPDPDFEHYFRLIDTHSRLSGREITPYLPIEVSRGCSYRCAYCSEAQFFKGIRHRPAGDISASLKYLSSRYNVASIFLIAQMVSPSHFRDLFQQIASHHRDYRIHCEIRASLDKEDLLEMKRAGVAQVQIGIEALDTRLLKKMNKGTRLIDNLKIMKYCEEVGIRQISNLIVGFPTETQGDIDRSIKAIDYAISYRPPYFYSEFILQDGSLVYYTPLKYGLYDINNASMLGKYLPRRLRSGINLWFKSYKSRAKRRDYRGLRRALEKWNRTYDDSQLSGKPLLFYIDFGDFLRIEDLRIGRRTITLQGWIRELFIFCDAIRGSDEINAHFKAIGDDEVQNALSKLLRLKVIFREDDNYVSLATSGRSNFRHHMPFI